MRLVHLALATLIPALTFPALLQADPLFLAPQLYPVAGSSEAVAVGDVNGDGRNDVLLTTTLDLYVYLQRSDGSLAPPVKIAGAGGTSVAVGDVNGDGRQDVVVASGREVAILRQAANGTLLPMERLAVDFAALRVAIADFNGDGRLDIVSIPWGSNSDDVDLFLQRADGTLGEDQVFHLDHWGYDDLTVGDVTGDGRADLLVTSGQGPLTQNVSVLPQSPAGGFGDPIYYDLGTGDLIGANGIGDVNHDGRNDILVGTSAFTSPSAVLGVFAAKPAGGLQISTLATGVAPIAIEVGDLDLDGRSDVVVLHRFSEVGYYLQQTNGTLGPETRIPLPFGNYPNPHELAVADVNSDGLPDLVIANDNEGLIVLRHTTENPLRPCDPGQGLCLLGGRFEVRVAWKNQHDGGSQGVGHPVPRSDTSGTFWFFDGINVELILKMLDGRSINNDFWLFYGALSDVEYDIVVFDTQTGATRVYHNPPGDICGRADTQVFTSGGGNVLASAKSSQPHFLSLPAPAASAASTSCETSQEKPGNLCLQQNRIQVQVHFKNQHGGGMEGDGVAVPESAETGFFWFFDPTNLELAVKVLDGRTINGHFWIYYGALSD
ncbi:MAG TPA: VCBS repeat-containing protein, partial [Thermoanaerobaculia bacterium]|nr:VCBS repeat-containing protein [Thermoanaerobaculia bacterium]